MTVVLFHAGVSGFSGGYVGVDVFFVISGYLITKNISEDIDHDRWSISRFYVRRARRLLPALFATLVATFITGFLLLTPELLAGLAKATAAAAFSTSNVLFWLEAGYFDEAAELKPLLHTWSLAVEEQFYLIWPMLIALLARSGGAGRRTLGIATIGFASLLAAEHYLSSNPFAVFYLTPFRMFEFCLGAMLVYLPRIGRLHNIVREIFLLVGLTAIILATWRYDADTRFPGLAALLPCLGAAGAIVGGQAKYLGMLLRNSVAVWIGLISYSLYLVHWPILVFYKYLVNRPLDNAEKAGLVIVSMLAAVLMYRLVETPLRRAGARSWRTSSYLLGCFSCMLALGIVSMSAYLQEGWSWRVHQETSTHALKNDQFRRVEIEGIPGYFIGDTTSSKPHILLIGDSHAGHLARGMDEIGRQNGLTIHLYSMPACPPMLWAKKIFPPRLSDKQTECEARVDTWRQLIRETPAKVIAIAGRWALLTEPTEYAGITVRRDLLADAGSSTSDLDRSRVLFHENLDRLAREVADLDKRLVLFGQIPFMGKNPKNCNVLPRFVSSPDLIASRCQMVGYEHMRQRLQFADNAIRDTELRYPGQVLALVLSDYLCNSDSQKCEVYTHGVSLYRDAHHLSAAGSVYLGRKYSPALTHFLGSNVSGSSAVNQSSQAPGNG